MDDLSASEVENIHKVKDDNLRTSSSNDQEFLNSRLGERTRGYAPHREDNERVSRFDIGDIKKIWKRHMLHDKKKQNKVPMLYGSQGYKVSNSPKEDFNKILMLHASQGKKGINMMFASYKPQVEEKLKEVSVSYGSQGEEGLKEISVSNGLQLAMEQKKISVPHGLEAAKGLKEVSVSYELEATKELKEVPVSYGLEAEKLKEISVSYDHQATRKLKEVSVSYDPQDTMKLKEVSVSYEPEGIKELKEVSVSYGLEEEKLKEVSMSYEPEATKDLKEVSVSYGSERENLKEVSISYEPKATKELKEVSVSYEPESTKVLEEVSVPYNPVATGELKEVSMSYRQQDAEENKDVSMQRKGTKELKKVLSVGPRATEELREISVSYDSQGKSLKKIMYENYDEIQGSTSHRSNNEVTGEGRHHVHAHSSHSDKGLADVFFFHDALRPGSIITPTIPPTTFLPALLPRHVADTIPFSTDRFADIVAMFSPASLAMAGEIRWALGTCQHPRPLPGEKAGCATSVEALAELSTSLLGTREVQAFSAATMPAEDPGTPARRGRYIVTGVQRLSESSEIVTCHDLTYPYAVFYCHTANPTAAYMVTMSSEDGAAPALEVLAVCHLDTSRWSPENPFFVAHIIKPGDVAVCHFLTKLSIIWVPAEKQGTPRSQAKSSEW